MPETQHTVPEVHLRKNSGRLDSENYRAFPLPVIAGREKLSTRDVVSFLDVEHSLRYKRTPIATFCNIYAHDICYQLGVYLPRVWWSAQSIRKIHDTGEVPDAVYGISVFEVNANSLFAWLALWGEDYGWKQIASVEELQGEANKGSVGVISGSSGTTKPGHISIVVPETPELKMAVLTEYLPPAHLPVQSQAGAVNFCFSCGTSPWWRRMERYGFWVHELK